MKTTLADKWFSKFIRIRDADEDGICTCITCGRKGDLKYMDCGHYVKRQHMGVRFSEMNCAAQCKHCNAFEQGRDYIFRQRLIEKYGEDKVLLLESSKRTTTKMSGVQLNYLAEEYKTKATNLAREKGIELW